jgi:two-component system, NtrC family, response regulator AtoC
VTHDAAWGVKTEPVPGDDGVVSLLIISEGLPRVVALAQGVDVKVGRATTADVVIEDTSLSRLHAAFRLVGEHVEVEDLASSNGTVLRGTKIAPGHRERLAVGDSVHLGAVLVVVQRRVGADRQRPAAAAGPSDELVGRIATSTISVLILGETGVGKEVMAERLHSLSPRRDAPLVKINCAALMTSVLESELFGHERGAFTGATKDKPGLVESADGGTLFLDEIGEAPPAVQVKLLRVLETRETQRIGALRPLVVDVRFIAATNRVPAEQIETGALRADLYHRLAGFTITIPPLRERRGEIPSIVSELLARHKDPIAIRPDALARLTRHSWPGNVRELRNVLERARVLASGSEIALADVEQSLELQPVPSGPKSADKHDGDPERARILTALEQCGGNQTMAAEKLGMSRRALVHRLQLWGMTRPRRKRS